MSEKHYFSSSNRKLFKIDLNNSKIYDIYGLKNEELKM